MSEMTCHRKEHRSTWRIALLKVWCRIYGMKLWILSYIYISYTMFCLCSFKRQENITDTPFRKDQ